MRVWIENLREAGLSRFNFDKDFVFKLKTALKKHLLLKILQ